MPAIAEAVRPAALERALLDPYCCGPRLLGAQSRRRPRGAAAATGDRVRGVAIGGGGGEGGLVAPTEAGSGSAGAAKRVAPGATCAPGQHPGTLSHGYFHQTSQMTLPRHIRVVIGYRCLPGILPPPGLPAVAGLWVTVAAMPVAWDSHVTSHLSIYSITAGSFPLIRERERYVSMPVTVGNASPEQRNSGTTPAARSCSPIARGPHMAHLASFWGACPDGGPGVGEGRRTAPSPPSSARRAPALAPHSAPPRPAPPGPLRPLAGLRPVLSPAGDPAGGRPHRGRQCRLPTRPTTSVVHRPRCVLRKPLPCARQWDVGACDCAQAGRAAGARARRPLAA